MRVLFRKIRCPFIYFCKPSPSVYTPGPLKLENSPHVPSTEVVSVTNASCNGHEFIESTEVKEESVDLNGKQSKCQNSLRSCIKKSGPDLKEIEKKKVQWKDFLGKELVEIREFEPSKTEDTDSEDQGNRGCVWKCVIL